MILCSRNNQKKIQMFLFVDIVKLKIQEILILFENENFIAILNCVNIQILEKNLCFQSKQNIKFSKKISCVQSRQITTLQRNVY